MGQELLRTLQCTYVCSPVTSHSLIFIISSPRSQLLPPSPFLLSRRSTLMTMTVECWLETGQGITLEGFPLMPGGVAEPSCHGTGSLTSPLGGPSAGSLGGSSLQS